MKLSVEDVNGPDAYKAELVTRAVITLDGKPVDKCTEADEEAGQVTRYIPKDDPRWQGPLKYADFWPTETLTGVVRIIDPEAEAPKLGDCPL